MYTIYYGKEALEIKVIEEQLAKSPFEFDFLPVGEGAHEIPNVRNESLIFYLLKKNDVLPATFASNLKRKYPLSTVGCICAGDCHSTKEISLKSGADFFLVSVYESFIDDLEENIMMRMNSNLSSHEIQRDRCGLTADELFITRYLVSGLTEKEIAKRLCIGYETLKKRKRTILNKLKLQNQTELTKWALLNVHGLENVKGEDPLLKEFLAGRLKQHF